MLTTRLYDIRYDKLSDSLFSVSEQQYSFAPAYGIYGLQYIRYAKQTSKRLLLEWKNTLQIENGSNEVCNTAYAL